jgi:hypothetical protein
MPNDLQRMRATSNRSNVTFGLGFAYSNLPVKPIPNRGRLRKGAASSPER